jgi:acetylornithine/N-succinyldiaminopimelate aminotransferase
MGRTGEWFAHSASGIVPDVVTVAKGLAGGIPIGACIALGAAGDLLQPGNHGSTFGGNPVAAAAGLAVVAAVEDENLLENARVVGQVLRDGLVDPRVREVRGRGLLIGLDLDRPAAAAVAAAALARGFIVNDCTPERIRLAPPLVLTTEQAATFTDAWPAVLDDAYDTYDTAYDAHGVGAR